MVAMHPGWLLPAKAIIARVALSDRGVTVAGLLRRSDHHHAALGALPKLEHLPPMRRACVELAVDGLSNPEIAGRLGVTVTTVKNYLSLAYRDLGIAIADGNPRARLAYLVGYWRGQQEGGAME